jgi:hypothetical protein
LHKVDHGRFASSCQHGGPAPKSVTVSKIEAAVPEDFVWMRH